LKPLRLISLFAGIGGFERAFTRHGVKALCSVEINPNCRAVLRRHFPLTKLLDDVTKCDQANLPDSDILSFGWPCQDLSSAGLRRGFNGERSVLFFEALRITDEKRPLAITWENVPGLLSSCSCRECGKRCGDCGELAGADDEQCAVCGSDKLRGRVLQAHRGADLYAIVSSLNIIGYSGAWTLLDARYFGVPQRRQRLFGVFTRLDLGAERCAQILSLPARLQWNPEASGQEGQIVAGTLTHSARKSSPNGGNAGMLVAGTISAGNGHSPVSNGTPTNLVAGTVSAKWKKGTGGPSGDECQNLVTAFPGRMSGTLVSVHDNISPSVTCINPTAVAIQNCTRGKSQNGLGIAEPGEPCYTLDCASQHGVAFKPSHYTRDKDGAPSHIAPPLVPNADKVDQEAVVLTDVAVRRLTPRETERLQGYPDDWTAFGLDEHGNRVEMADTTRYEMTGNSVAVPCVDWIAGRIVDELRRG
jgi:DNA (cytosine-5)-methyltransferase 1